MTKQDIPPFECWLDVFSDGSLGRLYASREAAEECCHPLREAIAHIRYDGENVTGEICSPGESL